MPTQMWKAGNLVSARPTTSHCAQSGVELLDTFEQIECESGTGQADPEVPLQILMRMFAKGPRIITS